MTLDNSATQRRTATAIRILLPLFFMSGATSLAYQVVWMRELQLVFGTSTFAVSTLLASFMAGLAAGGFAISRFADRFPRPLAVYGILELGIGAYALVFPLLLTATSPLYIAAWRILEPGPVAFGAIQSCLAGALLLLPTAAMGATLPLLARFTTFRLGGAGDRIGTLYAVNTLGAVVGIWYCGFVLLPQIGLYRTSVFAAAVNLVLGATALGLDRWVSCRVRAIRDDLHVMQAGTPTVICVYLAMGLAGSSALIYEVSWTRVLTLMLGSATYTFSIMLIAFLAGIALGGKLGGPLADRILRAGGRRRVLFGFAVIEIGIAVVACSSIYFYPELPFWFVGLFDWFEAGQQPEAVWWVALTLAGLVMTPPAILMGMHFPIAVRAVVDQGGMLGRPVGIVYGANAIGGALGAFLAGFVLLPGLGMRGTIFVAAAVGLVAAGILMWHAARQSHRRWGMLLPIAVTGFGIVFVTRQPPWNPLLMTSGLYQYVSSIDDHSREGILQFTVDAYRLLFYEEGLSSVVTVAQNVVTPNRWIAINGKVDASTTDDMPTQVLLSLLPMQFVQQPDDVLVIGLASGVTAGAASLHPEVDRLQIVELEPVIGRAARYFDEWNHSVLSDPRVELIHNDGRNHLLLAEPESYDLIVSEPSNPWIAGAANLFTREFLEIGRFRLKPGGVWAQWVPIYGMDTRDVQSILATFADVYPYALVYAAIEYNDLVLIGSDRPLHLSADLAQRLLDRPALAAELTRVGVDSDLEMISLYLLDRSGILEMSRGVPLNTDDNMFIELSTASKLHLEARRDNYESLLSHARLPESALADDPDRWASLARSYRQRGDLSRSAAAISRAEDLLSAEGRGR